MAGAVEAEAHDLFGGEGMLEESSGGAPIAPSQTSDAQQAAKAGEGLSQGAFFDDDDGMVLSGAAPPLPNAAAPKTKGEKRGKPQKGKGKEGKTSPKKKKGVYEEMRSADPWGKQAGDAPSNVIVMPQPKRKKKTGLSAAKHRKLMKRLRRWAVVVLAGLVVLFYTTGTYITVAAHVAETFDSLRIMLSGGDGYPVEFGLADYIKSEALGDNGMVLLGGSEAAVFASNGRQLRYLQHNYLRPGVVAGQYRFVIYSRGGTEYSVESRSRTIAKNTTDQEILFCSMSPGGWLGVVTASRYRANLQVLAPPYNPADPQFSWPLVDDKPVALAFHSDNKSMVLGSLSAEDGALGTTLYLLRTDRSQVQGTIRADNATLLQLRYLDNHRVLAVYDSYTATYNSRGQELNRFDYAHRRLLTANIYEGRVGLVFGTASGEDVQTVLLDKSLKPLFDVPAQVQGTPRALVTGSGLFVQCGQMLLAYNSRGALTARTEYPNKVLGLAYAGEPLLMLQGEIIPIGEQLRQSPLEAAPSHADAPSAAAYSVPELVFVPQSQPESTPEGDSQPTDDQQREDTDDETQHDPEQGQEGQ